MMLENHHQQVLSLKKPEDKSNPNQNEDISQSGSDNQVLEQHEPSQIENEASKRDSDHLSPNFNIVLKKARVRFDPIVKVKKLSVDMTDINSIVDDTRLKAEPESGDFISVGRYELRKRKVKS